MIRDWYVKKLGTVQTEWMLWETTRRKPTSWYLLISRMFFFHREESCECHRCSRKTISESPPNLFIASSAPSFLISPSIFPLASGEVFPDLLLHPLHFYRICVFFLTRRPSQAAGSSAGDEQQPFPPMSHRHANGKPIRSSFVDAAATTPPGPGVCLCVRVVIKSWKRWL